MKATDIRIEDVTYSYEDFHYRTPIKFGGVALDRATVLNAHVTVRTVAGKTARGFGSMPMGNVWSFPSKTFTYDQTLHAMKSVVEQIARLKEEIGLNYLMCAPLSRDTFRLLADEVLPRL